MCILVTIICVYFTPLMGQAFSITESNDQSFNPILFSFGSHCFLLALKAGIRWINYYRVGQKTSNLCLKIKKKLEEILMDYYASLSKQDKAKLKILIQRFEISAPYRPLSVFDLNLSAAISTAGLVATYLVILVQFKQTNIDITLQKWQQQLSSNLTTMLI